MGNNIAQGVIIVIAAETGCVTDQIHVRYGNAQADLQFSDVLFELRNTPL
jgi:hypothetical protein